MNIVNLVDDSILTSVDGWKQRRARPFSRCKGTISQLLQAANPLIANLCLVVLTMLEITSTHTIYVAYLK